MVAASDFQELSFPSEDGKTPPNRTEPATPSDVRDRFAALYPTLHRMAQARLRGSAQVTVLQTTALLHESFVRMAAQEPLVSGHEGAFWAYASRVMHTVIVDHARRALTERRGGHLQREVGDPRADDAVQEAQWRAQSAELETVLRVHEALETLKASEPELAAVVEMQYFGGFTDAEIAQSFRVTDRTIRRAWAKAKALLRVILEQP